MQRCNFKGKKIQCRENNVYEEIKECMVGPNRFNLDLTNMSIFQNIDVKCFDFKRTFNDYTDYMGKFLDSKAIISEYVMRDTNKKRNKTNECVWTDPAIQTEIKHFLKENYDYYSFCDTCLGSQDDLFG